MASFKAGELDVLVATTVIEVGVDVPNATIMIVQEADRFGLAQLHQLRGRVGRGAEQSYCLLVSRRRDELTETAVERLEAMVETTDGFELAERDLELRGEGQLLGARQSGLTDLRFTRLRADRALLEQARDAAATLEDEGLLAGRRRPSARRASARRRLLTNFDTPGAARTLCRCVSSRADTRAGALPRRKARTCGRLATACVRRSSTSSARWRGPVSSTCSPAAGALGIEGALAGGAALRVRRVRRWRSSRHPAEPRAVAADRSGRGATRRARRPARGGVTRATSRPRSLRPALRGRSGRRSSPPSARGCRGCSHPTGCSSSRRRMFTEPQLPLDPVTSRRYGSARITIFRQMP